ncbi:MAG: hypothetical protein SGPRY_014242, partial [Prymnesium sp.]
DISFETGTGSTGSELLPGRNRSVKGCHLNAGEMLNWTTSKQPMKLGQVVSAELGRPPSPTS